LKLIGAYLPASSDCRTNPLSCSGGSPAESGKVR
jgi:hypothetical protein